MVARVRKTDRPSPAAAGEGKGTGETLTVKRNPRATHRIYVVDLDPSVWHKRATMRKANPRYMPLTGKGYLYVGATSKTAEERLAIHKAGGLHSAPVVRIFGRYLRPRLYSGYKRMSRKDAEVMEPYVAERLRKKGFAVWPVKPGGLFSMPKPTGHRPSHARLGRRRRRAA